MAWHHHLSSQATRLIKISSVWWKSHRYLRMGRRVVSSPCQPGCRGPPQTSKVLNISCHYSPPCIATKLTLWRRSLSTSHRWGWHPRISLLSWPRLLPFSLSSSRLSSLIQMTTESTHGRPFSSRTSTREASKDLRQRWTPTTTKPWLLAPNPRQTPKT